MAHLRKGVGEREGTVAHGDADAANLMKVGGFATAALRAAVDENDVVDLSCDLQGQLRVVNDATTPLFVDSELPAAGVLGDTIGNPTTPTVGAFASFWNGSTWDRVRGSSATGLIIDGNVAHDDADAGDSVLIGGHANASLPTAVDENDRVRASFDLQGQLRVIATGSTGGTSAVDDSVFTGGSTNLTPMGALFDATPPTITDGNIGAPLMTSGRILRTEAEQATAANLNAQVVGNVAHDDADAGNPLSTGFNAARTRFDPPQIDTDGDRVRAIATPQGIQWVLGGHPNITTREYMTTAERTNDPIIDTIPAGSYIVILEIEVLTSVATTANPQVRIGFGTTTVPTEPTSGNTIDGLVISHPGLAAGSGVVRGTGGTAVSVGGSNQELRITNDAPTGGQITVLISYYVSSL